MLWHLILVESHDARKIPCPRGSDEWSDLWIGPPPTSPDRNWSPRSVSPPEPQLPLTRPGMRTRNRGRCSLGVAPLSRCHNAVVTPSLVPAIGRRIVISGDAGGSPWEFR